MDAFVIHRNMKNSKNNAQFSPSYVPILVCNFSIYVYNSCYTYQMFCFVCFFSLIKAFRLITISLNLSQRQYYITFSFIERDREWICRFRYVWINLHTIYYLFRRSSASARRPLKTYKQNLDWRHLRGNSFLIDDSNRSLTLPIKGHSY